MKKVVRPNKNVEAPKSIMVSEGGPVNTENYLRKVTESGCPDKPRYKIYMSYNQFGREQFFIKRRGFLGIYFDVCRKKYFKSGASDCYVSYSELKVFETVMDAEIEIKKIEEKDDWKHKESIKPQLVKEVF